LTSSKKSKGFTLIELMIALVILSITLLALAGLMIQSTRNTSWGGHLTEAATFAQDKFEEFRALRPLAPPSGDIAEGIGNDARTGSTGIQYTRNWNVVTFGNARSITITVTWTDTILHSISIMHVIST